MSQLEKLNKDVANTVNHEAIEVVLQSIETLLRGRWYIPDDAKGPGKPNP